MSMTGNGRAVAERLAVLEREAAALSARVEATARFCRGCRATLGAVLLAMLLFGGWQIAGGPRPPPYWSNCCGVLPALW